jgi:hypothetical protein
MHFQNSEPPAVGELVSNKVQAPALVRGRGCFQRPPRRRTVSLSSR